MARQPPPQVKVRSIDATDDDGTDGRQPAEKRKASSSTTKEIVRAWIIGSPRCDGAGLAGAGVMDGHRAATVTA